MAYDGFQDRRRERLDLPQAVVWTYRPRRARLRDDQTMTTKAEHGELFVPSAGLAAGECTWQGPSGVQDEKMGRNHVVALNKLGADGWLVVAVSDGPQGTRYVLSRSNTS
jgi:hypothetical protein